MRSIASCFLFVTTFLTLSTASAMDELIESVAVGCDQELTSYCANVTPGEGRILACIYAHEDKLSGQCEYALYDAAAQLERFISGLTFLANECNEDLGTHCAAVEAGEGRLAQCLLDNKAKLTKRCATAVDSTGLALE